MRWCQANEWRGRVTLNGLDVSNRCVAVKFVGKLPVAVMLLDEQDVDGVHRARLIPVPTLYYGGITAELQSRRPQVMSDPKTLTLTITQGTPEWAFIAACRALETIEARASRPTLASVTLYADGSGELRIPARDVEAASQVDLIELTGSRRVGLDPDDTDLVIYQCSGFAYRELE